MVERRICIRAGHAEVRGSAPLISTSYFFVPLLAPEDSADGAQVLPAGPAGPPGRPQIPEDHALAGRPPVPAPRAVGCWPCTAGRWSPPVPLRASPPAESTARAAHGLPAGQAGGPAPAPTPALPVCAARAGTACVRALVLAQLAPRALLAWVVASLTPPGLKQGPLRAGCRRGRLPGGAAGRPASPWACKQRRTMIWAAVQDVARFYGGYIPGACEQVACRSPRSRAPCLPGCMPRVVSCVPSWSSPHAVAGQGTPGCGSQMPDGSLRQLRRGRGCAGPAAGGGPTWWRRPPSVAGTFSPDFLSIPGCAALRRACVPCWLMRGWAGSCGSLPQLGVTWHGNPAPPRLVGVHQAACQMGRQGDAPGRSQQQRGNSSSSPSQHPQLRPTDRGCAAGRS